MTKQLPATARRTPAVWLATGLGLGLSPVAPGTFGALWGLPIAWALGFLPLWGELAVIAALVAVGIPLCTRAARDLGGLKDPGAIVWDEIASMPIVFLFCGERTPAILAIGFVLHRIFDISKPPPARQLERLPDGLGIMADDLAAAGYGLIAMQAILWAWARM